MNVLILFIINLLQKTVCLVRIKIEVCWKHLNVKNVLRPKFRCFGGLCKKFVEKLQNYNGKNLLRMARISKVSDKKLAQIVAPV